AGTASDAGWRSQTRAAAFSSTAASSSQGHTRRRPRWAEAAGTSRIRARPSRRSRSAFLRASRMYDIPLLGALARQGGPARILDRHRELEERLLAHDAVGEERPAPLERHDARLELVIVHAARPLSRPAVDGAQPLAQPLDVLAARTRAQQARADRGRLPE